MRSGRLVLVVLLTSAGVWGAPPSAWPAGGMQMPSSGQIGTTGWFLSCRSTTSSDSSTPYYDKDNVLRTWDCGSGRRPHKGVDILGSATPGVTPVRAASGGTVWTAERGNGLGWRVVIRHPHGLGGSGRHVYTIYGHMGDCSTGASLIASGITPGTAVVAGQLIGYQGTDSYPSGCASRSHLHWEVRASTQPVSNVFLATPASPNFYTGLQLTADDPSRAGSVSDGHGTATPSPTPGLAASPTASPAVTPGPAAPAPTFRPHPDVTPAPSGTPKPRWVRRSRTPAPAHG